MGIFFSQQNNQPKKDKIYIEPILENNLQPVISSDVQNIIKSINQPILPPLEIQEEPKTELHFEEKGEKEEEKGEKEDLIINNKIINSIKEEKHIDQENIHEHIIKYNDKKDKKKKKKNKK